MASPILNARFDVDISAITKSLHAMDEIPRHIMNSIAHEIERLARAELIGVFSEAMELQSNDAFPTEFRIHMLSVLEEVPFQTEVSATSFAIDFDFNSLGTRVDLERAFHQGALLADGKTRLHGPYTGQALYNPANDPIEDEARHIYWRAVNLGLHSAPNAEHGHVPVPLGAWEETKQAYLEIWGNKAPNWIYLQFGQNKWEPEIRSFPIIETFTTLLNEYASGIFESRVIEEIEAAQRQGAVLTPYGARLTEPSNLLGPSGKPRKPGQFYPLR